MFSKLSEWIARNHRDERGFTLVELMVVLVIIGILVAVLLIRLTGRADLARENAVKADLRAMKSVIEIYYAESGDLPTAANIDDVLKDGGIDWDNTKDHWGNGYGYGVDGDSYVIASKGKGGSAGGEDDIYVTEMLKPTVGNCPSSPTIVAVSGNDTW